MMLRQLRERNPDFNWPNDPEPRNYPEEIGAILGDRRRFRLHTRQLVLQTSNEADALEYAKTHKGVVTFNPVRLETYGVWI